MAFSMKRNDTSPAYVVDLVDNAGLESQTAINLTDATSVTFKMREAGVTDAQAPKVSRTMTILSAVNGRVQHNWQAGDTDETGDYEVEFQILWDAGGVETIPNDGYMTISVVEDLDAG